MYNIHTEVIKVNESFAERLKRALDARGMNQTELVERTGISKSAISQYLSGVFEPKQNNIYKISRALSVGPTWLMGKDVEMESSPPVPPKAIQSKIKSIPIIGQIAAGIPILAEENVEDYFNMDSNIKADFALRIKGDSMTGAGIFQNDIVFIRQQNNLENGEIGAILIENEATLKKFYKEGDTIILQAENDYYKPMIFKEGNICILGKLVAVLNIRE